MENFLQKALYFIARWNYVFYAVGLVGILLYLHRAREAYYQRKHTPFPIEREEASAMLRDSLVILSIFIAIIATTFYIDRILLAQPSMPEGTQTQAAEQVSLTATSPAIGSLPTPDATATPEEAPTEETTREETDMAGSNVESSGAGEEIGRTATETPTVTPTPTPQPEPTQAATAISTQPPPPTEPPPPDVPPASCETPGVRITSPTNGEVVSGNVNVMGTASIDRFQFYKVEFGEGKSPGNFAVIGDVVRESVVNGYLASWPASSFSPGVWTLRLTAVDETGNFPPPCDIHVVVSQGS